MGMSETGFTLIELLIVVAMLGILLPVGYSLMLDPLTAHEVESARMLFQADFDKVHRLLGRDIRSAAAVVAAMDELRCSSTSLILEIPVVSDGTEAIAPIRVCYSVSPAEAGSARREARTLIRDVFKRTESGWQKERSYPVSRTLSGVRFTGDKANWGNVRRVTVDLFYEGKAVHTALVLEQPKVVALRGARS